MALLFQTRRVFHVFSVYAYVKSLAPGRSYLWRQGYNLKKLGRGLLGDATYQILRL